MLNLLHCHVQPALQGRKTQHRIPDLTKSACQVELTAFASTEPPGTAENVTQWRVRFYKYPIILSGRGTSKQGASNNNHTG